MNILQQNIKGLTLACILAGAAGIFLGFPNPLQHFPFLALLHPAALYIAGKKALTMRQAFVVGFLCAAIGSAAALYWLVVPAQNVAGLHLLLAIFCPIGVGIYIGSFSGVFCASAYALKDMPAWRHCLMLACIWYLLEYARGFVFSGFPWLTLASAFAPWPSMLQAASLIGSYALGGVFALAACLMAGVTESRLRPLAGVAILAALCLFGLWRMEQYDKLAGTAAKNGSPSFKVAFIEGNVDQNQKWNTALQRDILALHIKLSEKAIAENRPDLLIWPETAMPFHYQNHPIFPEVIRAFAREQKIWLLFGAPGHEKKGANGYFFYNRAYLVDQEGRDAGFYEKEHLVPFGEYLPPWLDFDFAKGFLQGLGDFEPGKNVEPLQVNGLALGILICYETIFPELAYKRIAAGATILVNISNDQWFGLTSAPKQHLQLASLRAIEQYRWLLRGTSSGISVVYDPMGRLVTTGNQQQIESVSGLAFPEKSFTVFYALFPFLHYAALVFIALLLFLPKKTKIVTSY